MKYGGAPGNCVLLLHSAVSGQRTVRVDRVLTSKASIRVGLTDVTTGPSYLGQQGINEEWVG